MAELTSKEEIQQIWALFRETDKQIKETDRKLTKLFEETDRRFKETDRRFKETDKKIKELAELFTGQWGKLIEALVEPSSIKTFQERGIKIEGIARHLKKQKGDEGIEIDLLLTNDQEVVVLEVKTTVKIEHVKEHLERLNKFKQFFPEYRNFKVYGGIAGIRYEEESDKFAYRQGLFVLKSEDGIIKISNDEKFKPRVW